MSNSTVNNNEIPFGTIIDSRYLIQKVLGQGGLGRTYLALDTHRFNEPCVLKEFAPLGSGQYDLEKSRNLFKREAKILHQITHPQIPKFLACFEGKGRLFLVQEYVKGKTYSQLLQERQQQGQVFSEAEAIRWLMNMLPILIYIHQRGIIHRDISPDNIMQPQEEELPVLIDFGVGKLTNLSYSEVDNLPSNHNQSFVGKMSFVGKIGYAPREQISMGRCSPSSDLYALGVTAIVLLTGKMPTLLLDQYTLEWQWRKYAQTSREFSQILDKMIEDRPMQRYQAAEEIISNLQELRQNQGDILTPELAEITDAHFYQKIALFSAERTDKTSKKPELNFAPSSDEETIINPSFSSRANAQPKEPNPPLASTFNLKKAEVHRVKPAPSALPQKYRQVQSPLSIEDTVPANTSIGIGLKGHSFSSRHSRASGEVSSPSLSVNFSPSPSQPDFPPQTEQNLSSPPSPLIYTETLHQPSIKPNTHQVDRKGLSRARANPVSGVSQTRGKGLEIEFVKYCQQELAYMIGPMASLIVQEVLVQYEPSSSEELVNALAEQIPDTQTAIKFKRKLLS